MRATVCLPTLLALALTGVLGGIAQGAVGVDPTPSETGATGLYRVSTLDGVGTEAIHVAAFGELTRATDLLVLDDVDTRAILRLAAAADIGRRVELFASLSASYNRDQQPSPGAPAVLKTAFVPDLSVGTKVVVWRTDVFAVGGELGARLPLSSGALPEAISSWFDALVSANLWSANRWSLHAHMSVGYYLDNSQKQFDVTGLTDADVEVRLFEHAAGDNRIRSALGLEGTFQVGALPKLGLFGEYHLEVTTGAPDDRLESETPTNTDAQWATIGVKGRIRPWVTVEAGFDLAIHSPGFAFGPPLPPFGLWAGVAVPFETSGRGHNDRSAF